MANGRDEADGYLRTFVPFKCPSKALMHARFLLLAPLLLLTAACDSGSSDPDDLPPDVDDGSVTFADVYVADVTGTEASFFRANEPGICTDASLTLRFNTSRFELECIISGDGENVRYSPSGTFRYVLDDRSVRVTTFGYVLEGTAPSTGERITGTVRRGNEQEIAIELTAAP